MDNASNLIFAGIAHANNRDMVYAAVDMYVTANGNNSHAETSAYLAANCDVSVREEMAAEDWIIPGDQTNEYIERMVAHIREEHADLVAGRI